MARKKAASPTACGLGLVIIHSFRLFSSRKTSKTEAGCTEPAAI